jgi:hypothetical protein
MSLPIEKLRGFFSISLDFTFFATFDSFLAANGAGATFLLLPDLDAIYLAMSRSIYLIFRHFIPCFLNS